MDSFPSPSSRTQTVPEDWLIPQWRAPQPRVGALMTTRCAPGEAARLSAEPSDPYAAFNLGDHVGDEPLAVAERRRVLASCVGGRPVWLNQVHGARVVPLSSDARTGALCVDGRVWHGEPVEADGSWTREPGLVCTVMVADCLPVLLAAPGGRGVAALHAGWRGLCGAGPQMAGQGVIESGVRALCEGAGCDPHELQAWLGACIGPRAFEVGADVLQGCGADPMRAHPRFAAVAEREGKWWADLPGLARDRLLSLGVRDVSGGDWCTVSSPSRFFSFRRSRVTGRQAACIWLNARG